MRPEHGATTELRARLASLGREGLLDALADPGRLAQGCERLAQRAHEADELGVFLSVIATAGLAAPILREARGDGVDELRRQTLAGEAVVAVAITERGAGSDVRSMSTTLSRGPDGGLRLDGAKWHITNAPEADAAIVFAMNATTEDRFLTAVLVRRGDPGVVFGPPLDLIGCRGSPTGEIALAGVPIAQERILGRAGDGQRLLELAFVRERLLAPWPLLGKMEKVIVECLDHAATRQQFGQAIQEFQWVQDKILGAYEAALGARLLAERAVGAAARGESFAALASLAKARAADAAVEVFRAAVEVHGSYGVQASRRYGDYLHDALCAQIAGGTRETHKKIVFGELRLDRARTRRGRPSALFRWTGKEE